MKVEDYAIKYRCPLCGGGNLTGRQVTMCTGRAPAEPLVQLYCPDCRTTKHYRLQYVKSAVTCFEREVRHARA